MTAKPIVGLVRHNRSAFENYHQWDMEDLDGQLQFVPQMDGLIAGDIQFEQVPGMDRKSAQADSGSPHEVVVVGVQSCQTGRGARRVFVPGVRPGNMAEQVPTVPNENAAIPEGVVVGSLARDRLAKSYSLVEKSEAGDCCS
jgi:hypothetical protein